MSVQQCLVHITTSSAFYTINCDGELLGLALITHDISDGAGVEAAVFGRGLLDGQGIKNLLIPLILVDRLIPTVRLPGTKYAFQI